MTHLRDIYYCPICKNVVELVHEGAEALVCCGKPMEKLEEQSKDAATEKHVPYVEETENGVIVKVGQNQMHPMTEKHYIKFIEIHTKDKVCRVELTPEDEPVAEFPVKKSDIIKVREYCNVHGLWKS